MAKPVPEGSPDEPVAISHKDHDGLGRVTRRQFEKVYEPKGWKLASKKAVAEAAYDGEADTAGPGARLDDPVDPVAQAKK